MDQDRIMHVGIEN